MKRLFWCLLCALLGLMMTAAGLLVPAHLRAVESRIVELAGRKSRCRPMVEEALTLLEQKQVGPAQALLMAARSQQLPNVEPLALAVGSFSANFPREVFWGCADVALANLFPDLPPPGQSVSTPAAFVLVKSDARSTLFKFLGSSPDPVVQDILDCREFTNTVLFPSASSSSGQAWETAIALTALLARQHNLSEPMAANLSALAREAARGGSSARFEQAMLDMVSLGQRLDWGQLSAFLRQVENAENLRHLAHLARQAREQLPVLFAAVQLSGKPAAVSDYLMEFSQSGLKDLGYSLRYGAGGVKEVLARKQRLILGGLRRQVIQYDPFGAFYYFALDYCWLMPGLSLAAKWLFYLAGGFYLAAAVHYARPAPTALEKPLLVPGFSMARELLFALGFLLVVLLLSEPFLAQESQKVEIPFRLRLPTMGAAVAAGLAHPHPTIMNQISLLTLLLFFVLQALIYTACLVKLAEIRRQQVEPRLKLRLLENEDHLFDAGLYLGFVGTIISLILVSLGIIKFSLMAAYSSTSFGIVFVCILKIFHVRPLRRKLILESEANPS